MLALHQDVFRGTMNSPIVVDNSLTKKNSSELGFSSLIVEKYGRMP
jgi:hypothetical protein